MTTIQFKPLVPGRVGFIVVHCSATKPSADWTIADVRRSHLQRGFIDVGYHFFIRRDGTIEEGRPLNRQGAHVERYNHLSVGVCLSGGLHQTEKDKRGNPVPEDNYTPEQWASLTKVLLKLKHQFPGARIVGHRDIPGVAKACPCFDVAHELTEGRLRGVNA